MNGANGRYMDYADGRIPLGMVVSGSLSEGVKVRLDDGVSIEDIKVGTFVSLQGQRNRFLGVLTEIALESTDDGITSAPPDMSSPLLAQVLSGTIAYNTVTVEPMLIMGADTMNAPQPAKTIPPHFSRASLASEEDIQMVFGSEDAGHFYIGNPMDMEVRLCLDIDELVKRSNGVFGKSGTGKTFLTRLAANWHIATWYGQQSDFRYARRVWLARVQRAHERSQGAETAFRLEGSRVYARP